MAGKGSRQRPTDRATFDANFDRIFGKTYKIQDIETGEILNWTIDEILNEINRERSHDWSDYNQSDWKQGWLEWVDGDVYQLLEEST
jgi:uncharacterized protein with von Willebrand factor type A (vWA) domain